MLNQAEIFKIIFESSETLKSEWMKLQLNYTDYENERIDHVDIIEPIDQIVNLFIQGNPNPIKELFRAIEKNYHNVDNPGKDFIQSGIIEVLETSTHQAGLDSTTCYKMLMNQEVIRLWNYVI